MATKKKRTTAAAAAAPVDENPRGTLHFAHEAIVAFAGLAERVLEEDDIDDPRTWREVYALVAAIRERAESAVRAAEALDEEHSQELRTRAGLSVVKGEASPPPARPVRAP
jgi:hypothetical protein